MKKLFFGLAIVCLSLPGTLSAASKAQHSAGVGARLYQGHTSFTNQPFSDGDISYNLGYEYREGKNPAYWQIVVGFTPELENEAIKNVITPELNLMYEERCFQGGVGILNSFVDFEEEGSDSLFYYHLTFGLHQQLGSITIAADALYAYEDWGDLSDFEFDDLEYGLWVTYRF